MSQDMRWVPAEATEEMLNATKGPGMSPVSWNRWTRKRHAKLYRQMVAAALSLPAGDGLTETEKRSAAYLNTISQPGFLHYPKLSGVNGFVQRILAAPRQPGEVGAGVQCNTCKDTGVYYVGQSGREDDGNGPVTERCPECGYGDATPAVTERQQHTIDCVNAWLQVVGLPLYSAASAQQVIGAGVEDKWERFAAWLLDHCEGQTITEEFLQEQMAKMLASLKGASDAAI